MKKIYYESPTVEVVEVRVESGFIGSEGFVNGGIADYSVVNEDPMEEYTGSNY